MNMDIVIIDDDAVVLFLHKILVQKSELPPSVHDFDNAAHALDFVSANQSSPHPLLIFLDINMPGISGWDFLERLDELVCQENIYVVMVTSSINQSDREKARAYPRVISYLEKPLSTTACNVIYQRIKKMHAI